MKIRILNPTDNNIISMEYHQSGGVWSTRNIAPYMFLQGGAPTTESETKLTATPSNEWITKIYDIPFLAWAGRQMTAGGATTYIGNVNDARETQSVGGNNWNWQSNVEQSSLRFHLLGAYGYNDTCDSRANIQQGDHVEVDYIIFGSTRDQLNAWTSYLEDSSNAAA